MTYFRVIFSDGRPDHIFESPEFLGLYMFGDVFAEGVQNIVIETCDLKDVAKSWISVHG